tara:strand:+ start:13822 stop:14208 length:387 start_codon:yes stop_codon:yes gene_type:complete
MSAIPKTQTPTDPLGTFTELDIISHPVIYFLRTDPYLKSSDAVEPVVLTRKLLLHLNKNDIRDSISLIVKELKYSKILGLGYNIFTNILNALALTATLIMLKLNKKCQDDETINVLKQRVRDSWKLVE